MRNADQPHGVRASALWGSGKRGKGSRSSVVDMAEVPLSGEPIE